MNGETSGNRGPRRAGNLALASTLAAAVALLATACSVQTYTSYPTAPAGSAAYRQETAFVQCMRGHGVPDLPDPPPGGFMQVPPSGAAGKPADVAAKAVDACKHLLPRGRKTTKIMIG